MKISKDQIRMLQTLKRQVAFLCKDRATWEQFLSSAAGRTVASSTELTVAEGGKVIDALREFSREAAPNAAGPWKGWAGRPNNMNDAERGRLLKKVEACLTQLHLVTGQPKPWAYADKIAKQSCRVDKIQFCLPWQLYRVVQILEERIKKLNDKALNNVSSL